MTDATPRYTAPGLAIEDATSTIELLDDRMVSLIDLGLTLKHIHWNVVGPTFIAVHEMLDPQHEAVRTMVDDVAERIATLGGSPNGTPGHLVDVRSWDDYALGRAPAEEHLAALDLVYAGVITDHRVAQEKSADLDPITEDLLIGQIRELELFHWFVRAHLENASGELATSESRSQREAADAVS